MKKTMMWYEEVRILVYRSQIIKIIDDINPRFIKRLSDDKKELFYDKLYNITLDIYPKKV